MRNKDIRIEIHLRYAEGLGFHVLDINSYNVFDSNVGFGIFLKHRGACSFARAHPHRLVPTYGSFTSHQHLFLSNTFNSVKFTTFDLKHSGTAGSGQRLFITTGLQDFMGFSEISAKAAITSHTEAFLSCSVLGTNSHTRYDWLLRITLKFTELLRRSMSIY